MTRIANFHQYESLSNDMMRQQVKLERNHDELASGKRVITSGDDPIAAINIQNFKQQNIQIEQYLAGINLARSRQNVAEILIAQSERLVDSAKNTGLKVINGSLSLSDRKAYQQEWQSLFNHFLDLANTKDESSNFIFAGTQSSKQPFFRDKFGHVEYVGDSYYRTTKIAPSVEIQTSDPGDKVFMTVKNPFGNYLPEYLLREKSSLLLSQAMNSNKSDNATYEVIFSIDNTGNVLYDLTQDDVSVSKGVYNFDTGIEWGTLNLLFQGEMQDGDRIIFERQDTFSIFDAFKNGIALTGKEAFDVSATAELQKVIRQLSQAFEHMNEIRSEIGARLNTLDRQEEMHLDFQLVLKRLLGDMEDLDYAKAVIEMNENMLALQSSQQAFAKTKVLNLFSYI